MCTFAESMKMSKNIHDVCDYFIISACEAESQLSNLKLQKLLYYSQAWYLAFKGQALFYGKFQAWIHGPVNREIYNRFLPTKSLYSAITDCDVLNRNPTESFTHEQQAFLNSILEVYMPYSGTQLEEMTHGEKPWQDARKGYSDSQRCEQEISEKTMMEFYSARVAK